MYVCVWCKCVVQWVPVGVIWRTVPPGAAAIPHLPSLGRDWHWTQSGHAHTQVRDCLLDRLIDTVVNSALSPQPFSLIFPNPPPPLHLSIRLNSWLVDWLISWKLSIDFIEGIVVGTYRRLMLVSLVVSCSSHTMPASRAAVTSLLMLVILTST